MVEPRLPPRSRYRLRVALVVAVLAGAAVIVPACSDRSCNGNLCTTASAARQIDTLCSDSDAGSPTCELSGNAQQTTGITDDTTGIVLDDGALIVHLVGLPAAQFPVGTFDVELLVATTDGSMQSISSKLTWGSCGNCSTDPPTLDTTVSGDYSWVRVVTGQVTAPIGLRIPNDATLTLTGTNIDIADIRTTSTSASGCSIAGPIGAR